MSYLQQKSKTEYHLKIKVKPNSKKQNIIDNGDFLTIFLRSKAIQNKANKELLNLIKKNLKISSNQIQIISGLKKRNKIIHINFFIEVDKQDIINKIIGKER